MIEPRLTEFLAALDVALEVARPKTWEPGHVASVADRKMAWTRCHDLRRELIVDARRASTTEVSFKDALAKLEESFSYIQAHPDEFGALPGDSKFKIVNDAFMKSLVRGGAVPDAAGPMKFYIAARFSRRPEAHALAKALIARGHSITSRWVKPDSDHVIPTGLSEQAVDAERTRFALEDLEDVRAADCVVSLMESPRSNSRGGRHVEFGIGLGLGRHQVIIGPRETVFHHLPGVEHFESVEEFLDSIPAAPPAPIEAGAVAGSRIQHAKMHADTAASLLMDAHAKAPETWRGWYDDALNHIDTVRKDLTALSDAPAPVEAGAANKYVRKDAKMFADNLRDGWIPFDPPDTKRLIEVLEAIAAPSDAQHKPLGPASAEDQAIYDGIATNYAAPAAQDAPNYKAAADQARSFGATSMADALDPAAAQGDERAALKNLEWLEREGWFRHIENYVKKHASGSEVTAEVLAGVAKARSALSRQPSAPASEVYEAGWRQCAKWAAREDLISDIGSDAYLRDRDRALAASDERCAFCRLVVKDPCQTAPTDICEKVVQAIARDTGLPSTDGIAMIMRGVRQAFSAPKEKK